MSKNTILFLIFFITSLFSVSLYGQQETILKMLVSNKIDDCDTLTCVIIDEISDALISGNTYKIDSLLYVLDFFCGKNESIQRIIIFNAIINKKLEKKDIEIYLKKDFNTVLTYRKYDSKSKDYLENYNENKDYFGYLPLRHPIDSIISFKSKELLETGCLDGDEKLFCILFAKNNREFQKTLSKKEFKNSETRKVRNEIKRQNSRNDAAFIIYSGIYSMVSNKNNIFGYNPYAGFSISSPLKNKFIFDFGMNIRFNINDSDFLFNAMGVTNSVNSKTTILIDTKIGYKILDKKRIILIPDIGVGFESTGTGITEEVVIDGEESYKFHNLNMLNVSTGFTIYTPVFVRNYIGLSINYHYCPYQWNKKLITEFNNNSLTCGLLYRF